MKKKLSLKIWGKKSWKTLTDESPITSVHNYYRGNPYNFIVPRIKGGLVGRSDTVSLWYVSLLINTRFRFFTLE